MENREGYIIVLTGNGKGKTTSALGMAMRAAGQGLKVIMLQFLKGSWRYGELESAEKLAPRFTIRRFGSGFVHVRPEDPAPEDVAAAKAAWDACREALTSGDYDMVIMDEINNAVAYGLISIDDVLDVLKRRKPSVHAVLTGRDAHPLLIDAADTVTEMKEVKHPYRKGEKARKGIEY